MGITTVNVFATRETTFHAAIVAGEPVLKVESGTYTSDLTIFLGNGSGPDGVHHVEDQLAALELAVAGMRRLWSAELDARAAAATDPGDGPDDPTDEPTDEPVHRYDDAGRWCYVHGSYSCPPAMRAEPVGDDRDPIERYGTPEHEAWLVEMERMEP